MEVVVSVPDIILGRIQTLIGAGPEPDELHLATEQLGFFRVVAIINISHIYRC